MKLAHAMRLVLLTFAAVAAFGPATANAEEWWWFDHREGRFPVAYAQKEVKPSLSTIEITDEKGTKYGPCTGKSVGVKGKIYSKVGGMGEGSLSEIDGKEAKECTTNMADCKFKIEPLMKKAWGLTLNSSKKNVVTNFSVTIELEGACAEAKLPKHSEVTGTVEGSFADYDGSNPAKIAFSKSEIGTTKVTLDGFMGFGTELTALAEPEGFKATTSPTTIDGNQLSTFVFTRGARTVECEKATLTSTVKDKETTVSAAPAYSNCKSGIGPATVKMNGCEHLFHVENDVIDVELETYTFTAPTDLKCPAGKEVEIEVFSSQANHEAGTVICRYNLGETGNQELEQVDLTNKVPSAPPLKSWIEAHVNMKGIDSKRTSGSALICGAEKDEAGTLKGTFELKGTYDTGEGENGIWLHP